MGTERGGKEKGLAGREGKGGTREELGNGQDTERGERDTGEHVGLGWGREASVRKRIDNSLGLGRRRGDIGAIRV